ncbi:PD-(D/E)XK nuclease-like domain-containing protein [Kineosporia sp. J2-2]|uniref:PD-(D/E)XK nuclease-like domain-containing protein n=1 Tax=Kineosporia corallincola TaxID=2835133 RepID=A0ABS5TMI8_9ACTN|nr:PD-(D/E)XK nuclease-like domain-containing protein [Kineosporia corallincola]MBT0772325.1 PD-(D/E)XK nuclease-like domain-containing protein [Kineosporia corallincola]
MSARIPGQRQRLQITQPGVYDLNEADYLRDPVAGGSLSATGIKHLIPPNRPAHFQAWKKAGIQKPSESQNFGSGTHTLILGRGAEVVAFPRADGRTKEGKAIKADADAARAEGKIVVSEDELETIKAMKEALWSSPWASTLLHPGAGLPEQTMIWQDPDTGVWCRGLVDYLRKPEIDGRLFLVDYKTADCADPDKWIKKAYDWGYHIQRAQYVAGAYALGLASDIEFIFLIQEKTAPYLVNQIRFDAKGVAIGNYLRHQALTTYAECLAAHGWDNPWPGYTPDLVTAETPGYIAYQHPEVD